MKLNWEKIVTNGMVIFFGTIPILLILALICFMTVCSLNELDTETLTQIEERLTCIEEEQEIQKVFDKVFENRIIKLENRKYVTFGK